MKKFKVATIILALIIAVETAGFGAFFVSSQQQVELLKDSADKASTENAEEISKLTDKLDSFSLQIEGYAEQIREYEALVKQYEDQIAEYDRQTEILRDKCVLPCNTIYQKPELPNGCEITAATIALNYFDLGADKVDMAYNYLERGPYDQTDPNEAYMGDPGTHMGFYCLEKPIVNAINGFLADQGVTEYQAVDITGSNSDTLRDYIRQGYPVIFWATVGFKNIRYNYNFTLPDGNYPYTGLHCMVVSGYDSESMYLNDPLGKNQTVSRGRFDEIYNGMGQHAVVIVKTESL